MVNQLDYTMKKLSRPLDKIGNPKPYFSESWRAKTSMNQIYANVEALKALYLAGENQAQFNNLYNMIVHNGNQQLASSISEQFDSILENWPSEASLFELLQTKNGYRTVLSQYNKLDQLKYLLAEEAAIELGIVVGFNATDGD
jgi:predicted lipoprotein